MSSEYNYLRDIVAVPLVIWRDKNLNPTEKMILVDIIGLIKHKVCFKGNQGFGELVGLSKDRISKILSELKRRGYIDIKIEKNSSNNSTKRTISLTPSFRKYVFNGLAFEESSTVEKDDSEGGIVENNHSGVSLPTTRGVVENNYRGIVADNQLRSQLEEVKEDVLNINKEQSSFFGDQSELFENEEPLVKPKIRAKKEKKEVHPSHYPIRKFWFEEFSVGAKYQTGDGSHINRIIENIYEYLTKNGCSNSPSDVIDFFKLLCHKKIELKNTFHATSGLSILGSSNHFKSIVDNIKLNSNGNPINNTRQSREQQSANLTAYLSQFPDPRKQRI